MVIRLIDNGLLPIDQLSLNALYRKIVLWFLWFSIGIDTAHAASCKIPLKYKIDSIDERFKIKEHEITAAVTDAARLWEEAVGRSLFGNAVNADLTVTD